MSLNGALTVFFMAALALLVIGVVCMSMDAWLDWKNSHRVSRGQCADEKYPDSY